LPFSSLAACGGTSGRALTLGHLQQREGHRAIVDFRGKAGHVRTVPVPDWVIGLLNDWTAAAGIKAGSLFRRVSSVGKVWGSASSSSVATARQRLCQKPSTTLRMCSCGAGTEAD